MSRVTAILTAGLVLFVWGCGFDVGAGHVQEDFEKTVQLDIDGEFSLENVNGAIQVETWDRDEVRIMGRKRASSEKLLKRIEIEVKGERNRVEVRTRHRKPWNFFNMGERSVDYEIWVPELAEVEITTVNGQVEIDSLAGSVRAKTVNGYVSIDQTEGDTTASTVNGSIEVRYGEPPESGSHEFSTVNGGIDLYLPSSSGGRFKANTVNGSIETDFPLAVKGGKWGAPKHVDGRVGDSDASFELNTVNGGISVQQVGLSI